MEEDRILKKKNAENDEFQEMFRENPWEKFLSDISKRNKIITVENLGEVLGETSYKSM